MYILFKDILNPLNWKKLFLNKKKIKNVFDRLFYYPGLKFGYSKSNLYKNLSIKILIYFARKNKKFRDIFFSNSLSNLSDGINFDFNKNVFDDEKFKVLKNNGVIVLENVLNSKEHKDIQYEFYKNLEIKNYKEIENMKSKSIIMRKIEKEFNQNSKLDHISSQIAEKIYGKKINSKQHYLYSKAINLPEEKHPGDNIFHVDRFLPNLKMIYFPFKVDRNSSPFGYAMGSHKINSDYLDFFLNNENWIFDERNPKSKKFLNNKKEIEVKENSLIIALTNGFHSRTPFTQKSERFALFFTYPDYNLLSLIFSKS
mgnify:CR=1 FL=1